MAKNLKVLLIEDNLIEIMKMKRTISLLKLGHTMHEAKNGEEALKILEDKSKFPDIILLDLNMPKMSGIEFLTIIKDSDEFKHIPIIILTTSDNQKDLLECYRIGISGYILKPLKYDDYVKKIEAVLAYWSINELKKYKMKGIVFTEFLELVEEKFGLEMVDKIIYQSELKSEGIYTAVGTYSFSEMLQLLTNLSGNTGISTDDLLLVYAEHFFTLIEKIYPGLLASYKSPIEMLASIEDHIHVEVQKIYPDAELPTFIIEEKTENSIIMVYKSSRAMHHFGLGLMNKTFEHFNSTATIVLEKIKEDGTEVRFIVNKN